MWQGYRTQLHKLKYKSQSLSYLQKAQPMEKKKRIAIPEFIKIKNVCSVKDTTKKMKR